MRKFKCEKCFEWHGGFHLCVGRVWNEHEPRLVVVQERKPAAKRVLSEDHKAAMAEATRRKWIKRHAATAKRDAYILKTYTMNPEMSMTDIGRTMVDNGWPKNLSRSQIRTVLERLGATIRNNGNFKERQTQ